MSSLLCNKTNGAARSSGYNDHDGGTKNVKLSKSKFNLYHLPQTSGTFSVGVVDIMSDANKKPCFFRLFYPLEEQDFYNNDYEWPLWLPKKQYTEGLIHFIKKNPTIYTWILNWLAGSYHIPALRHFPFNHKGAPLPVLIFSHGLGGNRMVCSTLCTELASHGFLVATLEHQDGSSSMAYFLERNQSQNGHSSAGDNAADQYHERWTSYEKPEIFEDFDFHNKRLYRRTNECIWVLDLLTKINLGEKVDNMLNTFDLLQFKGKLDMDSVAIVGHSYGGATSLCALHLDSRIKVGIHYDAWMMPVDEQILTSTNQPSLFVNMAMFHWPINIHKIERVVNNSENQKVITIKGTVHQSTSDLQFILNRTLGKFLGTSGTLHPSIAMSIQVKAAITFLRKHLGLPGEQYEDILSGKDENVLLGCHIFRKDDPSKSPVNTKNIDLENDSTKLVNKSS